VVEGNNYPKIAKELLRREKIIPARVPEQTAAVGMLLREYGDYFQTEGKR